MSSIDHSKMDKFVDGKLVQEGKKENENGERINFFWWKEEDEDLIANKVANTIKFIAEHQSSRMEQLTVSTRLYGNTSAFSLIGTAFTRASNVQSNPSSSRIGFNLCASVIDTLQAKVAKNKVTPVFITDGGTWDVQQRAEDLSKFTEGIFYQTEAHTRLAEMFRQGGVWGTGILHPYNDNGKPAIQETYPHEIFIDLVQSLAMYPTQLHRVTVADRDVLLGEWADDEEACEKIRAALPANFQDIGGMGTVADLVHITESWHLPSNPDWSDEETDGRYVKCVGDKAIVSKPYTKTYYPFVFFNYCKRLMGFWGQGACERLQNLQGEINRLMILVQRSMWMGGSFKVLVENGSKVVSQHLNNDVGAIIYYTGTPPQYITPPMIQGDILPYIDNLIAKGFQQEGVSQLSASSMKPMGLDSGKALRTFNNIEADRQTFIQQQMEEAALELARQLIEVGKEIYKERGKMVVMFPSTSFTETIDWKDVKLDEDQYVMKAFPMSSLADDFSGRLEDVQEGMQAGLISPRVGRRLLRMPDVEMADTLANAKEDLLHRVYQDILRKGQESFRDPEPQWDLQLAKELGLEYYNYAQLHNCPEENMKVCRKFMDLVDDMLGITAQAVQAQAAASQPQAVPAAPPVSNLLPNAPGVQNAA